jgi:hypothetical protein
MNRYGIPHRVDTAANATHARELTAQGSHAGIRKLRRRAALGSS